MEKKRSAGSMQLRRTGAPSGGSNTGNHKGKKAPKAPLPRAKLAVFAGAGVLILLVLALLVPRALQAVNDLKALDEEAMAYARESLAAITVTWDSQVLLDRATPELAESTAAKPEALRETLAAASSLGLLMEFHRGQISYKSSVGANAPVIHANFTGTGVFSKGQAVVRLELVKRGEEWRINRLSLE